MAHPPRQVEEDVQIIPSPRRRIERLAHSLDTAFAVGYRALRLAPAGRGREDHVRHLGGRGEEDVLHDQEVEALEPMPSLSLVRFRLERVLAQDVERAEFASLHRLEHFRHVPAAFRGNGASPEAIELRAELVDLDVLEAREAVRKRPHVAAALDVVLPPQRIEARAIAAHVSGQQGEIDQREHVIDGIVVLGDPQGPADHRLAGRGERVRHVADCVRGDACFSLGISERIRFQGLLKRLKARRGVLDELPILESRGDDLPAHRIGQRDVGPDIQAEPFVGPAQELVRRGSIVKRRAPL